MTRSADRSSEVAGKGGTRVVRRVSLVAAALVAFAAVVRNIDGGPMSVSVVSADKPVSSSYGWPFRYAVREWSVVMAADEQGRWIITPGPPEINGMATYQTTISLGLLAINGVICVAIVIGVASYFRRTTATLQCSLSGVMGLIVTCGLLVATHERNRLWDDVFGTCGLLLAIGAGISVVSLAHWASKSPCAIVRH